MNSERWERIQTLFHDAAARPASERRLFLETACPDDEACVNEVLALLEEDAGSTSLLDGDVGSIAQAMLGDADDTLPSHKFGPYQLRRLLGEGGMGVVYLADREDLGSQVAIKILRDAWMSPARRARFESEQRLLAHLNHPSIARLYDASVLPDGTPWFAMEYVEGIALNAYAKQPKLGLRARLELFRSVCEAVQYAHRHAVIHRDLKPSNILVKEDGTVRLLDFGIAKALDSEDARFAGPADQTRTGLRLMTPAYAAPEQLRGQNVGIHTDVYALGVILYEMLTGELPFDRENRSPGEVEALIEAGAVAKPSEVAARHKVTFGDVSKASWADLDVLCLTAMHKDVERRYASTEALIRDVEHFLSGEPLEARPDSVGYRLGKFVGRHRGAVIGSLVMVALAIGLVTFFTVRLAKARNAAVAQAARTERIQRFMLNLFDAGDPSAGPSEDLKVTALLNRGVQEAKSLNGEPAVQAELYATLGGVYENLGKFDDADTLLKAALDRRRTLADGALDAASSEVALGMLRVDQAKLEEGESMVRAGLAALKQKLPATDPAVIRATTSLGKVLEARGKYDEAIAVMGESVRPQDKPGVVTAEFADSLAELANNHFYAGHYDLSDSLNQRVLTMYRQLYGATHPKVAEVMVNLGASQLDRGHYAEAEKYDRQALAINENYYGPDHPETASSLTLVGRSLYYQKRYDEAAVLLQRALSIQERVHGPVHPSVASALNELGNIASVRNQNAEAEAAFSRMAEIYRTVYHDHHFLIGIAESNLATVYFNEKQYERAEALYRDAIRRFTETQSAEHTNTGIARIKLGRVLLRQKRYEEAQTETLAGYRILGKQASPSVSWLKNARKDLREEYAALGRPDRAREFAEVEQAKSISPKAP